MIGIISRPNNADATSVEVATHPAKHTGETEYTNEVLNFKEKIPTRVSLQNHQPGVSTGGSYMAHWGFRVNSILVLILSDYRGPIYMGSNMTPWVLQGYVTLTI